MYYCAERAVFGLDGTSISLMIISRDGAPRQCVQPLIDLAAVGDGS